MTALTKQTMTVDEFLVWADGRDGRWELHDGVPVQLGVSLDAVACNGAEAMAPEKIGHSETKFSAAKALEVALNRAKLPCRVLLDGPAVRLDARTTFQPDIVVYCGPRLPAAMREVPNPVLVVEVLSPSTKAVDLRLKVRRYFELPSLHHYLILDPDDRSVIHHARGTGDGIMMRIASEGALHFDPPGFAVEIAELFPEPYEES